MSNAIAGVGTQFRRWNDAVVPGVWEAIAEITNIGGPSSTRDTIDVTSLDSTGGYREFIAGFRDAGAVTLTMNFTRDTFDIMKEDFENDNAQNYEIIFPDDDTTTLEFAGLVTEIPLTVPTDAQITVDVSIKLTGPVTVNSGSGPSAGA